MSGKYSRMITVRITPDELEGCHSQATLAGMTLNQWARKQLGLGCHLGMRQGNPNWKRGFVPKAPAFRRLYAGEVIEVGDIIQQYHNGPWVPVKSSTRVRGMNCLGVRWFPTYAPVWRKVRNGK